MTTTERTDPAAEVCAVRPIADLLQDADVTQLDSDAAAALAAAVLAGFVVVWETRGLQRRAVLYGPWEINPLAVATPAPMDRADA